MGDFYKWGSESLIKSGLKIPREYHLQKEEAERILEILNRFPPKQKQVFIMRLQGMCFRDIGLALNQSENWARVTYFRTKSQIRAEMEGK